MEKFITATGKTIDLAIAAALEELHMDRDSVSVEVLENPRSGFLGIGAQPARVKVTYEAPDEAPKPALSSASRSKPKKPAESKPADSAKDRARRSKGHRTGCARSAPSAGYARFRTQGSAAAASGTRTEAAARPEARTPRPEAAPAAAARKARCPGRTEGLRARRARLHGRAH